MECKTVRKLTVPILELLLSVVVAIYILRDERLIYKGSGNVIFCGGGDHPGPGPPSIEFEDFLLSFPIRQRE